MSSVEKASFQGNKTISPHREGIPWWSSGLGFRDLLPWPYFDPWLGN